MAAFVASYIGHPERQSRPVWTERIDDEGLNPTDAKVRLSVSEGPLQWRLDFEQGYAAQSVVIDKASAGVEFVTSTTVAPGQELVARYTATADSGPGLDPYPNLAPGTMVTDDGLVSELHALSYGSPVSSSFRPLRATVAAPGFTLATAAPTGVRPVSSAGTTKFEAAHESSAGLNRRLGGVEVMLHRSSRADDEKGLDSPLHDLAKVEVRHRLLAVRGGFGEGASAPSTAAAVRTGHAGAYTHPPLSLILAGGVAMPLSMDTAIPPIQRTDPSVARPHDAHGLGESAAAEEAEAEVRGVSLLGAGLVLPPDVHLMTMQWWPGDTGSGDGGGRGRGGGVGVGGAAPSSVMAGKLYVRFQHFGEAVRGDEPRLSRKSACEYAAPTATVDARTMAPAGLEVCRSTALPLDFLEPTERTQPARRQGTATQPPTGTAGGPGSAEPGASLYVAQGGISAFVLEFCAPRPSR
jgi:hypothetical protein